MTLPEDHPAERHIHDVFRAMHMQLQQAPSPENAAIVLQIIADFHRDTLSPMLGNDIARRDVITIAEQLAARCVVEIAVEFRELRSFVRSRCAKELDACKDAEQAFLAATTDAERFVQGRALIACAVEMNPAIFAVVAEHTDACAFALQMLAAMVANLAHRIGAPSSKN